MSGEKRRGLSKRGIALIVVAAVCAVLLLVFLVYRGLKGMMDGDVRSDEYAAAFLTALDQNDEEAAYGLLMPGASSPDAFPRQFASMRAVWTQYGGAAGFELAKTSWSWNSKTTNGFHRNSVSCVYRVKCGPAVFQLDLDREESDNGQGITAIWLKADAAGAPGPAESVLRGLLPQSAGQWVGLIYGLACLALMIFTLVDCIRRARRHKLLWVVLILLVNITFPLSLNAAAVRILVPLGTILYWCRRKGIAAPPEGEQAPPPPYRGEDPWDSL